MHTETWRERFTYAHRDMKGRLTYAHRHEGKGSLTHTETQRDRFTYTQRHKGKGSLMHTEARRDRFKKTKSDIKQGIVFCPWLHGESQTGDRGSDHCVCDNTYKFFYGSIYCTTPLSQKHLRLRTTSRTCVTFFLLAYQLCHRLWMTSTTCVTSFLCACQLCHPSPTRKHLRLWTTPTCVTFFTWAYYLCPPHYHQKTPQTVDNV